MTLRHVLILLVCAGVFAIAASLFLRHDAVPSAAQVQSEEYWRSRVRALGGAKAYAEFARDVANDSPDQMHRLAHIFGGALYGTEGLSGLPVCDTRFSYGCFHEFLGRAIADRGLGIVTTLDEECALALGQNALSCRHGIGHGIIASLGYTRSDLDVALQTCAKLTAVDPIGGCFGGVFMEYDLRTMLGDSGAVRQSSDLFAPCDSLSAQFLPSCVFAEPQWWHQSLFPGVATQDAFKTMGGYCMHWSGHAALLRNCFEGLGAIAAPNAQDDARIAAVLCDAGGGNNAQLALYCRSFAANAIGIDIGQTAGLAVCADLAADDRTYCESYARNRANILNALSPPECADGHCP